MFIIKFENSTSTHKKGLPCYLSWYRLPTPVFLGFPGGSACKEFACNVGDLGSIPGLGKFPREGRGYPLQHSGLEKSMDSPWSHKESDMTERLLLSHTHQRSIYILSPRLWLGHILRIRLEKVWVAFVVIHCCCLLSVYLWFR